MHLPFLRKAESEHHQGRCQKSGQARLGEGVMDAVILMVGFSVVSIGMRLVYMRLERGVARLFPKFRSSDCGKPALVVMCLLTFSCLSDVFMPLGPAPGMGMYGPGQAFGIPPSGPGQAPGATPHGPAYGGYQAWPHSMAGPS